VDFPVVLEVPAHSAVPEEGEEALLAMQLLVVLVVHGVLLALMVGHQIKDPVVVAEVEEKPLVVLEHILHGGQQAPVMVLSVEGLNVNISNTK
jgi:hypothetical protein